MLSVVRGFLGLGVKYVSVPFNACVWRKKQCSNNPHGEPLIEIDNRREASGLPARLCR
jgi:hypothetical protein